MKASIGDPTEGNCGVLAASDRRVPRPAITAASAASAVDNIAVIPAAR